MQEALSGLHGSPSAHCCGLESLLATSQSLAVDACILRHPEHQNRQSGSRLRLGSHQGHGQLDAPVVGRSLQQPSRSGCQCRPGQALVTASGQVPCCSCLPHSCTAHSRRSGPPCRPRWPAAQGLPAEHVPLLEGGRAPRRDRCALPGRPGSRSSCRSAQQAALWGGRPRGGSRGTSLATHRLSRPSVV